MTPETRAASPYPKVYSMNKPKRTKLTESQIKQADQLKKEIGMLRCWLAGFTAGRHPPNTLNLIPGEDGLRRVQIFLEDLIDGE